MTKRNVDWILIDALLVGSTQRDAAKAAHVSERTVRRRPQEREFRTALARRREEFREMSGDRVIASAELAVSALVDVMHNGPPGAQVKASVAVLDRVPLPTEPPAPPERTDHGDAMMRIRAKLDEMAERMQSDKVAQRTDVDDQAKNRTETDKTGHNRQATFPYRANPFPPGP